MPLFFCQRMDPCLNLGVSCRMVTLFKWPPQSANLCMEPYLFGARPGPFVRKNKILTIKCLFSSFALLEALPKESLQSLFLASPSLCFRSFSNSGGRDSLPPIKLRCSLVSLAQNSSLVWCGSLALDQHPEYTTKLLCSRVRMADGTPLCFF